jgi:tetratricopeptide (TPR) repeat protein
MLNLRSLTKSNNIVRMAEGQSMLSAIVKGVVFVGVFGISSMPAEGASPDTAKTLADASEAFANGDCAKVTSLASTIFDSPTPAKADDVSQAYDLAIQCAWGNKDFAKAVEYANRAIARRVDSNLDWRVLLVADFNAGRFVSAVDTIERMLAAGRGGALNSVDPSLLFQLHIRLERGGDAANDTRLLAILANPVFDPDDITGKISGIGDYLRALYARKLAAAGKLTEARTLIADLEGYNAMIEIAFDPELLKLRGKPVDFRAVVEADLARHRAMVERFPKSLAAINAVAGDLNTLGRSDEAIVLLKETLPRTAVPGTFDDDQAKLRWTWDALANAYTVTGNYDAMINAYNQGVKADGSKSPNVDQTINLAGRQYGFGRAADALATLERLGAKPDLSPYGAMQVFKIRGCANAVLGRLNEARAQLALAIAHERDAPPIVTTLNICVGDEAAAAASLVKRLTEPETRREAMLAVADYDDSAPRSPKAPFAAAYDRILKRPEVVRAIRAAGGRVRIHLPA